MVRLAEQPSTGEEGSSCQQDLDVGDLFRQAREEKKLSIPDVARLTHIRQPYLLAIEKGQIDRLPGQIYTIGFIKTYAQILGLDACEILRRLNLDKVDSSEINKLILAIPTESQERPKFKLVILTSFLAIALCSAAAVFNFWDKDNYKEVEQNLVTGGDSAKPIGEIAEESETSQQTDMGVSEQDQTSLVSEPFRENEVEDSKPQEMLAKKEVLASLEESSVLPSQALKGDQTDKISVLASRDSWVQVIDAHGKSVFVRLMHAGDQYEIPQTDGPYQLHTGNAGGIRLKLNNGITAFLGDSGKVMRGIPLTSEHIRQIGIQEESAAPSPQGTETPPQS